MRLRVVPLPSQVDAAKADGASPLTGVIEAEIVEPEGWAK